jgi:phosphatidylglycerophosphatase A
MKTWATLIATFFGVGYFPLAPGTLASLLVVLARFFLWPSPASLGLEIGVFLILSVAGTWASHLYAQQANRDDPRQIVIDEVSGQFAVLMALPVSPFNFSLAFFLFRFLDIVKPFPIRQTEKIKGGWGIMADDLVAGLLARFLMQIYFWVF